MQDTFFRLYLLPKIFIIELNKVSYKKISSKNKFWVHYINTENNTEISSDENNSVFGSVANNLGAESNILQNKKDVKYQYRT